MTINEAKETLNKIIGKVKSKRLAEAVWTAAYVMTYLSGKTVTTNMLEAMMLMVAWNERDEICESRIGQGCKGCPYDVNGICDKQSTKFVMRRSAKAFKAYFDEVSKSK